MVAKGVALIVIGVYIFALFTFWMVDLVLSQDTKMADTFFPCFVAGAILMAILTAVGTYYATARN